MSQVLEQPAPGSWRSRKRWWDAGVVALAALLVAGGWQLAGDNGNASEVLGAGKSSPLPSDPGTVVLGAQASKPLLVAPTITSGPAENSASVSNVRFTYSHSQSGVNFACALDNAAFARCSKDGISYNGLAAGPHFFAVAVQQGSGPLSAPASRNWTVGTAPAPAPPAPQITVGPSASTIDPDATFIFTSARVGAGFECRLDSGAFSACTSPKHYVDLAVGPHTFFVRATDSTGTSSVTSHSWTIVRAEFTISGSLDSQHLLAPGVTWPLNLAFTNPYNNAQGINITALEITVNDLTMRDGQPNPDCVGSENLTVDEKSAWKINVPRNSTVSLSDRISTSADWPQVTMTNHPWNQDACKNTVFTFSYTGTAEK
jgi:hypothetical protein